MSPRFPLGPIFISVLVTFVLGLVIYFHNEAKMEPLRVPQAPMANAGKVPRIQRPAMSQSREQEIYQHFQSLQTTPAAQLGAFAELTTNELVALLHSNEVPWEGADIGAWKEQLFARFGEIDSQAALRLALEIFPEPWRFYRAVAPLVQRWALTDPQAADAWWQALPISLPEKGEREEIERILDRLAPPIPNAKLTAAIAALPNSIPEGRAGREARKAVDAVKELTSPNYFQRESFRKQALEELLEKGPVACSACDATSMAAHWERASPKSARAWLDGAVKRWPAAAEFAPAVALARCAALMTPTDVADYAQWAVAKAPAKCVPDWWCEMLRACARNGHTALGVLANLPEVDFPDICRDWLKKTPEHELELLPSMLEKLPPAQRTIAQALYTGSS